MLMKRKIAFNKPIQLMSKNVQNTRKLLINFTDFFSFFPLEMTITEHGVPVFTPRSKVQPPVLNKPIKTSESIVKTVRFIQYGHVGKGTERFSDIQFSHVPLSTLPESRTEQ